MAAKGIETALRILFGRRPLLPFPERLLQVTLHAADFAKGDFSLDGPPARPPNHVGNVLALLASAVVELQKQRIGLPAIHARVVAQVSLLQNLVSHHHPLTVVTPAFRVPMTGEPAAAGRTGAAIILKAIALAAVLMKLGHTQDARAAGTALPP